MPPKKRVLFTIPNFHTAGSQYVLRAIYDRLNKDYWDPWVLVEKFPEYFPENIPESRRLILKKDRPVTYIGNLRKLVTKHQIHLVHSWDYRSTSVEAIACRLAGIPYLYTKKNNSWSKRWFVKSVLSKHIAYDNPEMKKRFFSHLFLKHKSSFVPHGIDSALFQSKLWGPPAPIFVIGCIGMINSNKNQMFILEALKHLPEHFHLQLYGKEEVIYGNQLRDFIKKEGLVDRVSLQGYIPNKELVTIIHGFDVLVQASLNEGLPLSILEAMSCGVPVLSSDSGGGARYLLASGGGMIFNLEHLDELIQQLGQLEADFELRKRMGLAGRKAVEAHFDLSFEVKAYEELYRRLAGS